MLRCRGDDDVSESRRQAFATRPIRHRPGDPRSCRIEGENAITVQMQDRIEPSRQISALARGTLAPQLGDSIHDFRYRYSRQE